MNREHLLSCDLPSLILALADVGMPRFRSQQIMQWVFEHRAESFDAMSNLSRADRTFLNEHFTLLSAKLLRSVKSRDLTEKILLQWPDGGLTESVLIPCDDDHADDYGQTVLSHRRTACLSTQVGCPVGCAFCASGIDGLKRNLTRGEIVEQALRLSHLLPADRRLTNIVFMGMGEPLANLDAVLGAIATLNAAWGFHISARKITVSTVGLPPQIATLASRGIPVTLAISLHAPNDDLRRQIIPWAKGISIEKIATAARDYFQQTGREVTLEYIMLAGVNTLPQHAAQLSAIAKSMRANVNLIYYNEVPDLPFQRPDGKVVQAFQQALRTAGVNAHVRRSRGRDVSAACGQLARQDAVALTVHARTDAHRSDSQ
jgi:23S rRNA (adenine2503-C2)-methyltransferase